MTLWTEYVSTLRGALALRDSTFVELRDDPDVFARGLRFLVITALIVGLVLGAYSFIIGVAATPAEKVSEITDAVQEQFDRMEQYGLWRDDPEGYEDVRTALDFALDMAADIVGVVEETTSAPHWVVALTDALGKVLSQPFSWIAMWLIWGLASLVIAHLLGGTATVQQMLGTTALVVAPHLLDALGFIPCGGFVLSAIAFFWGLFIYVKATAVANRFEQVWLGALAALGPILIALLAMVVFVPIVAILSAIG
ncbi:MAG: hypothetical protein ACK2UL_08040 [Anaerolineae bacterium]|jgi:hypothetical protein